MKVFSFNHEHFSNISFTFWQITSSYNSKKCTFSYNTELRESLEEKMFWNYHLLLSTLTEPNLRNSPFQTNHLDINYTLICRSNEAALLLMNEELFPTRQVLSYWKIKLFFPFFAIYKSIYVVVVVEFVFY